MNWKYFFPIGKNDCVFFVFDKSLEALTRPLSNRKRVRIANFDSFLVFNGGLIVLLFVEEAFNPNDLSAILRQNPEAIACLLELLISGSSLLTSSFSALAFLIKRSKYFFNKLWKILVCKKFIPLSQILFLHLGIIPSRGFTFQNWYSRRSCEFLSPFYFFSSLNISFELSLIWSSWNRSWTYGGKFSKIQKYQKTLFVW